MTSNRHVLVADDSEDIREIIGTFLAALGYRTDIAVDGQQALELFKRHTYDVLICDLQMPRLEGLALMSEVKAIDPDVVVVILTGNATLETAIEAMRLGAYDFLLKPVEDMDAFGRLGDRAYTQRALITENRRHVAELQKANTRLETEVAARIRVPGQTHPLVDRSPLPSSGPASPASSAKAADRFNTTELQETGLCPEAVWRLRRCVPPASFFCHVRGPSSRSPEADHDSSRPDTDPAVPAADGRRSSADRGGRCGDRR